VVLLALLLGVAAILALGVLGDYAYARVVRKNWAEWEAGVGRDADGVRTGCRAYTLGENGDPALLLIHGFGDAPTIFQHMAPALAEAGYRVRAMRLPGFAEPMRAYARTDLTKWREAVRREVAALHRAHDEVWILGHSTGATLGVRQALDDPASVQGLVLLAPLFGVSDARSPVLRPRTWFTVLNRLRLFTWIVENNFEMDLHDPGAGDYPYRDRFVPVAVYDDLYALLDEIEGTSPDLTAPLLMIVAADDQIVDAEASRAFFAGASSEPKELVERTDAGHVLPLDQGWQTMVKQIDAFVRAARPAGQRASGALTTQEGGGGT
jgi:alpha-beta hydrolase superfamily lysophospholipase